MLNLFYLRFLFDPLVASTPFFQCLFTIYFSDLFPISVRLLLAEYFCVNSNFVGNVHEIGGVFDNPPTPNKLGPV